MAASLTSSVLSLSVSEQDALMLAILQSRSSSSSSAAPAKKVVKKSKKAVGEGSDSEEKVEKPKREQSEGQKAWVAFVTHCRDIVREATWETTFPYKNALSVASALKKAGKVEGADKEAVLAAYHEYRREHPASDSESVASAKAEDKMAAAEPVVEEKKVVKKVAKKAPEAPFHGKWTHKGTEYERDDLAIYTLQGKWVGRYDPKKDMIDTSAVEPTEE